jgi:hypothetical protein
MTSLSALRKSSAAFISVAFVAAACGGGTPSMAPSTAAGTAAAPTTGATAPPASSALVTLPPGTEPPASEAPGVDPSAELEIAAPYTLAPLDEALAATFINAMKGSLGQMADVFSVGVRSAVKNGATTSWVIVMRFPELGVGEEALLDGAAAGAAGTGNVEKTTIGGSPVRIIEAQGSAITLTVNGNDLVMVVPLLGGKKEAVAVITAIIEAN